MNRAFKKLKNNSGESLAEVLIALLVASLGITLLAVMIHTSSRLVLKSSEKIKNYTADEVKIVKRSNSGERHQVNLVLVNPYDDTAENEEYPYFTYNCGQLYANVYKMTFGNTDIITFDWDK